MARKYWTGRTELVPCPLCDADRFSLALTLGESWTLVRCRECELVYVNPRPIPEDLVAAYGGWYSGNEADEISRARFRSGKAFKVEALRIKSFFAQGRILDIGCGHGLFLQLMKDAGWDAFGVEPSSQAAMYCEQQGLKVQVASVETVEFPDRYFDAVTLWYILEHLADPRMVLRRLRSLLKDDGLIMIRVPNWSFAVLFRPLNWLGLEIDWLGILSPPWHLCFFTAGTIKKLLSTCGFRPVWIGHGETYLYPSAPAFVNWSKRGVTNLAEVLLHATGGRLLMGPALTVYASKDG